MVQNVSGAFSSTSPLLRTLLSFAAFILLSLGLLQSLCDHGDTLQPISCSDRALVELHAPQVKAKRGCCAQRPLAAIPLMTDIVSSPPEPTHPIDSGSYVCSTTNLDYPVPPKPSSYKNNLAGVLARFASDSEQITIVSDAEYLNGSLGHGRPGAEVWKEVVQIGAVKYKGATKIDTFNRLVVPSAKLDMSQAEWDEFTRITNLQKDTIISNGIPFEEAWSEFLAFIGGNPIVVILGDREVYKWNFRLLGTNKDAETDNMKWIILKPLLPEQLRPLCSGELYELVGFTEQDVCTGGLTTHNALFDATSMGLFCANYKISS